MAIGNATSHWYEFLHDGQTGAEILADRIILHLTDGARGDGDGAADANIGGVILGLARFARWRARVNGAFHHGVGGG